MNMFLEKKRMRRENIIAIIYCKMYLQVNTISEMCNSDGNGILLKNNNINRDTISRQKTRKTTYL